MVVDTENNVNKMKNLMQQNIWLLWVVMLISIVWNFYVNTNLRSEIRTSAVKMERAADKMSKGIVLLDLLGRPVVSQPVELTPVNPAFKQAILSYIKMYGIYDWAGVTNNYTVKIKNLDELYRSNPDIKMFRDNFFSKDSQALKDFEAHLNKIIFMISKNRLPESVSIIDEKITSFDVKNGGFNLKAVFTVQAREYNARLDKFELREGHIIVDVSGDLDPSLGTPNNPLGIQFIGKYNVTLLEKQAE